MSGLAREALCWGYGELADSETGASSGVKTAGQSEVV
jgi:hypothetical protein